MAWIEAHQSLRDHRKVLAVAERLGLAEAHVAGHLVYLWLWAIDNAPGGILPASERTIEKAAGWTGEPGALVAAMLAAELLHQSDAGLAIHDWDEYAGRLMAQRESNRERQRRFRARHRPGQLPLQATSPASDASQADAVTVTSQPGNGAPYTTIQNTTGPGESPPYPPTPAAPAEPITAPPPLPSEPPVVAVVTRRPETDDAPPPVPATPSPPKPIVIVEAVCDELGQDLSALGQGERKRQCGFAARLIAEGLGPEDARRMVRWLRPQRWVIEGGGIDLRLLAGQVGKWLLAGRPGGPEMAAIGGGPGPPKRSAANGRYSAASMAASAAAALRSERIAKGESA